MNDFRRLGDYRNFIGSYRYQHRQYSDHAKEPPPMSDSNDIRTRIAAVLRTYMFENSTAEELADAVICDLGLTQQWLTDGIISDGEPRPWELPCETRWTTEWEQFDD